MKSLNAIENTGFSVWVRESGSLWSYPTIIFLHSLGLAFVIGLNAAIDLRLLGCAPRLPIAPMKRLFLFVAAAGANALGFYLSGLHRRVDATGPGQDVPFVAKVVGATSLLLWIGVMYWGRMLPFIGNAF
jgi:hypothetical protein